MEFTNPYTPKFEKGKRKPTKIIEPSEKVYTSKDLPILRMAIISIFLGFIVGIATIFFRFMIAAIYNLAFYGRFSLLYHPEESSPPSTWGVFIIIVPVIGAAILVWLVTTFVKNSDGHGVPEVITRLYHSKEKKSTLSGMIMGFSAAISIGTGGSTGNESPYIQVGASAAEGLSNKLSLSKKQKNILISASGAAALATCLNAPMTGIIFAIELILVTINVTSLFPVALCTITAVYTYRHVFGAEPAYFLPFIDITHFEMTPLIYIYISIVFGIASGLLSVFYIKLNKYVEKFFKLFNNRYLRHMTGMLLIGIILHLMLLYTGKYYIDGIQDYAVFQVLHNNILNPWFLLLLVFLKIFATSITVGSGSSGGVFTPLLFIGGVFGGFFCQLINLIEPGLNLHPTVFVMAGMAAVISSTIGAFLTGIIAVFEMFGNIDYVLPVILTASIACAIRKLFKTNNVYAMSLKEKGLIVPDGLQSAIIPGIDSSNVMSSSFALINLDKLDDFKEGQEKYNNKDFFILFQKGIISGILTSSDFGSQPLEKLKKKGSQNFMLFTRNVSFLEVSNIMLERKIEYAIISKRPRIDKPYSVIGIITHREIDILTQKEYSWLN